jgi:hypothetical protein
MSEKVHHISTLVSKEYNLFSQNQSHRDIRLQKMVLIYVMEERNFLLKLCMRE